MKLVRNKIPQLFPEAGPYREATEEEKPLLLLLKLQEEAAEVSTANGDAEMLEELADVLQVVLQIARRMGVTFAMLNEVRGQKITARGGFGQYYVQEER